VILKTPIKNCPINGLRFGIRACSCARGLYIPLRTYGCFDYISDFSIFLMTRALTHPSRSRIDRNRYEIHAKMAGHDNDRDGTGSNEEDGRRFQRPVDLCCLISSPIVSPAAPYGRSADLSWRRRHSRLTCKNHRSSKKRPPLTDVAGASSFSFFNPQTENAGRGLRGGPNGDSSLKSWVSFGCLPARRRPVCNRKNGWWAQISGSDRL
jgi:hypothetical protein